MTLPIYRPIGLLKRLCQVQFATSVNNNESPQRSKCGTAIMMFGSGNPNNAADVRSYFIKSALDKNILSYPFQSYFGPILAERKVSKCLVLNKSANLKYGTLELSRSQRVAHILNALSPETAPHMCFIGYQYNHPFIEEALKEMEIYDVERAVAISMQPHYSCSNTGSMLNRIFKYNKEKREPSKIFWSTIDRWASHPVFTNAYIESLKEGLERFPEDIRDDILIVFSASSTPLKNIHRGDYYHLEVAASVQSIMEKLGYHNPYAISWHSMINHLPWLGPDTKSVIKSLDSNHYKGALVVRISSISDSVLADMEFSEIVPKNVTKTVNRAEMLINRPSFIKGLAELIASHLKSETPCSKNLCMRCIQCTDEDCIEMRQYFQKTQESLNVKKKLHLRSGWSSHS